MGYPIYLVIGPCGAGKTTWIHQQLTARTEPSAYLCLGAGDTPIDLTYITATCANVEPIAAGTSWTKLTETKPLYIEIAPQLDLDSLKLPVAIADCQRIAIVPKGLTTSEWHEWANEALVSEVTEMNISLTASPRWKLTGEVIDPASLNVFWDELIQGAYGMVARAKGILRLRMVDVFILALGWGIPIVPILNCHYHQD